MFISVVPSVLHILVRVCCDAEFLLCFFRLDSTDSRRLHGRRVGRRKVFTNCANCISRMPSIVFDAHTVRIGCKNQVLFIVMSAMTGRTRIDWRYRTLKARRDSTVRCKARLAVVQSQSDQSVCDTDTDVPSINEPIPSVQVQSDKIVWCPRLPPRRLAYRTFFICDLW